MIKTKARQFTCDLVKYHAGSSNFVVRCIMFSLPLQMDKVLDRFSDIALENPLYLTLLNKQLERFVTPCVPPII